jgi:cellulose synthase/poly-beta-1,6-N-acetylglucosamine synthase-like glycosyltransferase
VTLPELAQTAFWASAAAVVYTYAVFPLLLFLLAAVKQMGRDVRFILQRRSRRMSHREAFHPRVAMLVAAYNEEAVIEEKLRNTQSLNYPPDKLELLLGLDCPEDSTEEIARRLAQPNVSIFSFPERRGKLAVINDLAQRTDADILVFSDANTLLAPDTILRLARHFAFSRTGAVCGELRLVSPSGKSEMESLYWRYEVALKFLENRLNCVLGANGGVYAVRRSLFRPLQDWIVEDFQLPMEIRFAGHRVVYDPEATATEEVAPSLSAEYRRKVRIGAGACQTMLRNPGFLNPFKGLPAFAYFSHKVLRWLAPIFLLAMLASSAALAARPLYAALLAAQAGFYGLALAGWAQARRGAPSRLAGTAYYFCSMNLALLHGMCRYLSGRQKAVWSMTPRRRPEPAPAAHHSRETLKPS